MDFNLEKVLITELFGDRGSVAPPLLSREGELGRGHRPPMSGAKSANDYFKVAVVIRPLGHRHPMSSARTLLSGARAEMCYKAPTALFGLGAINRGGAWAWLRSSILEMCCPCVCLV